MVSSPERSTFNNREALLCENIPIQPYSDLVPSKPSPAGLPMWGTETSGGRKGARSITSDQKSRILFYTNQSRALPIENQQHFPIRRKHNYWPTDM